MLNIYSLGFRILRSTLLLVLISGLLIGVTNIRAQATTSGKYCVQAVNMLPMFEEGVLSVVNVDVQTGEVTPENRPIATPDSLFSPDGNYAALWKAVTQPREVTSDNDLKTYEFGLYIVSVHTNHAVLLYSLRGDDFVTDYHNSLWAWSPDSSKFAYVSRKSGQFFINVVNAQGNGKQSKEIAAPKGNSNLTDVNFFGWSADSLYVGVTAISEQGYFSNVGEANVWTASNINQSYLGFILPVGFDARNGVVAWSPTGHRLALLVDVPKTQPAYAVTSPFVIWSPEYGIEAQSLPGTPDSLLEGDSWFYIYWSPKERNIILYRSSENVSHEAIFGINGKRLVKAPLVSDYGYIFGWTSEDSALAVDSRWDEAGNFMQVDAANHKQKTIESDVIAVTSGDKTKILLYRESTPYSFKIYDVNYNQSRSFTLPDPTPAKKPKSSDIINNTKIWSPDGTYVISSLFQTDKINTVVKLLSVDFINTETSTLRHLEVNQDFPNENQYQRAGLELEWVGTHWILYTTADNKLMLMNLQTGKNILLSVVPEVLTPIVASISPDKSTIAIQGKQAVIVMPWDKDGQPQHQVPGSLWTHPGGQILRPDLQWTDYYDFNWGKYVLAWSPDSAMLAFIGYSPTGDDPKLVVVSPDGKEILRKPMPGFEESYVKWVECKS